MSWRTFHYVAVARRRVSACSRLVITVREVFSGIKYNGMIGGLHFWLMFVGVERPCSSRSTSWPAGHARAASNRLRDAPHLAKPRVIVRHAINARCHARPSFIALPER